MDDYLLFHNAAMLPSSLDQPTPSSSRADDNSLQGIWDQIVEQMAPQWEDEFTPTLPGKGWKTLWQPDFAGFSSDAIIQALGDYWTDRTSVDMYNRYLNHQTGSDQPGNIWLTYQRWCQDVADAFVRARQVLDPAMGFGFEPE